ncbi:Uma2 family endonuclease [Pleurocapsa sp. PCC 7319]|uniref:Uma2 family endonuclease n=1 Tax=Pleurocapsa sp. PCC 7319 TaxID=118161 RepID=UPI00034708BC|nr:Uma2 family endonuclease [Pleurocapsa sp. PCC 7319]
MTTTNVKSKLTFEEYLNYDDGTDNRYEFVDGELLLMNPPIGRHSLIIRLIGKIFEAEIERLKLDWLTLTDIGIRTAFSRSRIPDLSLVTREQIQPYINVSAVLETPPILAIEVVSSESINRDYRYKRSEYAAAGISEYWIIDPAEKKVTVLKLVEGFYEEQVFHNNEQIVSSTFPDLVITVEQLWKA